MFVVCHHAHPLTPSHPHSLTPSHPHSLAPSPLPPQCRPQCCRHWGAAEERGDAAGRSETAGLTGTEVGQLWLLRQPSLRRLQDRLIYNFSFFLLLLTVLNPTVFTCVYIRYMYSSLIVTSVIVRFITENINYCVTNVLYIIHKRNSQLNYAIVVVASGGCI